MKHTKIIKEKGRVILVEKELREPTYWLDVLESLTFAEGMALSSALTEWSSKNIQAVNTQVVEEKPNKQIKALQKRVKALETEVEDLIDNFSGRVII